MTMTLIASAFHPDALWLYTPSADAPATLRKAAQKLADERAALVADYEQIAGREPGPRASGPEPDEARATCCREWADWVDRAGPWLRHAADVALAEGEYLDNKAREARAAFQRACREVCDEYGREIPILLAAARRPEIDRLRVAAAQTPGGQWLRERASALERLAKAAPGEASRLRSLADFFARRAAGAAERHAPGREAVYFDEAAAPAPEQGDGPAPPNRFIWRGRVAELQRVPWLLLSHLWSRRGRAAAVDDERMAREVWGEFDATDGQIRQAVARVNAALADARMPLSITRKAGFLRLAE